MRMYIPLIFSAVVSASALAQTATPLPANIVTDRATAMQAKTTLQSSITQLDTDEDAGAVAMLPADRTAIRIARLQYEMTLNTLRADAIVFLHADLANLLAALNTLHADQAANNTAALAADTAAVAAAARQLELDRAEVFAGLAVNGGERRHGDGEGNGDHDH